MKKFIAAFDGLRFSEANMDYAIFLAKHCNAHLVAIFLEDFTRHSYSVADIMEYEGKSLDSHITELNEKDKEERDGIIEVFVNACRKAELNHSIHRDKNIALHELLHESVYADLLIINVTETLTRFEESVPTRFIRDLLNDVQCPVLITPANYKPIDNLIMLYDGEPSSVYAVKASSYLFDPIKKFETEVITVNGVEDSLHVPENKLVKEFMKRHFPKAQFVVLKGIAEDEIVKYLRLKKRDAIVVTGAYRRGRVSRLFRPSMADLLMQHLKMPLFIAHNK
ncbi:MAG: universal stress protein [Flavisolibacter sp.]